MDEDIVVPDLAGGTKYKYHCFIAFSHEDEEIAVQLDQFLQQLGFQVAIMKRDFHLGTAVVDNIKSATELSRRAVVLVSPSYSQSEWFDYETLLFIHNSYKHKRQFMIPVCYNLTEEQILRTRLGVYNYIKYTGCQSDLLQIAKAVAAPDMPMSVSLPCGNVAQGLVWTYYYGYLRLVLPGISERCKEWCDSSDVPLKGQMIGTLFIFIPDTGLCHDKISGCDSNIQQAGKLKPVIANRAGVIERHYYNTIYSIKGDNDQVYYAPCEYATPVLTMYEMEQEKLAGLSHDELYHQILDFTAMLDQILSHSQVHTGTKSSYKLIFFKDEGNGKANVSPQIIDKIKEIFEEEKRDENLRLDTGDNSYN